MNGKYVVAGIILLGLLAGGVHLLRKSRTPGIINASVESSVKSKGGEASASIQIVEYSDFQCPACKFAQPVLDKLLQDYPGKINITFRHFPLPGHPWAALAHQAAECAHVQGKFWPYHDKVYGAQEAWSKEPNPTESFIRFAGETGLNLDSFGTCLSDPAVKGRILDEKGQGQLLQVTSTPTFFINGERLVGPAELKIKGENMVRKILGLPEVVANPQPTPTAEGA